MVDMTKGSIEQLLSKLITDITTIRNENKSQLNDNFNVFSAMRNNCDEVRLHSRFIASILDNNAPHNLGTTPIKELFDIIGIPNTLPNEPKLNVLPNYYEKKEEHEIDILITTKRHAVIIENKINHIDTNYSEDLKDANNNVILKGQLERYYDAIQKNGYQCDNIYVVYLTKDGHQPSDESVGNDRKKPVFPELKNKVISISYRQHILQWLQRLSTNIEDKRISFFINQYMDIVEEITESSSIEERKKLLSIIGNLSEQEKAVLSYLFKNKQHILWHNADEFLHTLIKESRRRAKVRFQGIEFDGPPTKDDTHFDDIIGNALTKIISDGKNKDFNAIYLSQRGVTWYITIDRDSQSLYFCINNKYYKKQTSRKAKLPSSVIDWLESNDYQQLFENDPSYYWIYFSTEGEYIKLTDEACKQTIMLTDNEYRAKIVDKILDELEKAMTTVDKLIASELKKQIKP